MTVRIFVLNGDSLMMHVTPGMTIAELQDKIAHKLNLVEYKDFFSLFESCQDICRFALPFVTARRKEDFWGCAGFGPPGSLAEVI